MGRYQRVRVRESGTRGRAEEWTCGCPEGESRCYRCRTGKTWMLAGEQTETSNCIQTRRCGRNQDGRVGTE